MGLQRVRHDLAIEQEISAFLGDAQRSPRVESICHNLPVQKRVLVSTSLPTVDILCIYVFYFSLLLHVLLHVLFYKNNFFLRLFKKRPVNIKMSWPLYD